MEPRDGRSNVIIYCMKTTLILVRHGKTEWNKLGKVQGQTNIPLSVEGKEEAKALAKQIPNMGITRVITSALSRAIQTAQIISEELKLKNEQYEELNERNYGELEGKLFAEADKKLGFSKKPVLEISCDGAESFPNFKKRVVDIIDQIVKKHKGETILIVCHGGVLQALARHFHKVEDTEEREFHFPNTSVSVYEVEEKKVTVKMVADTSHLK